MTGIEINRLEDSDTIKNALEKSGPLIEKIVAVCQGPKEANKWVQLLGSKNPTVPVSIKRNVSSGSINISQLPSHVSRVNLIILIIIYIKNNFNLNIYFLHNKQPKRTTT